MELVCKESFEPIVVGRPAFVVDFFPEDMIYDSVPNNEWEVRR